MSSIAAIRSREYIQKQEKLWLEEYAYFIPKTKILKVGNGLGHLSELIRPLSGELTILDIETYTDTINKERVQIYNGFPIPFSDKYFDVTIAVFTLHHIPHSRAFFKEIIRVTNGRIIIVEETYDNFFQKVHLFYRDSMVNRQAGQPCKLYWNSYFSRKELKKLVESNNLQEVHRLIKRHKSYFKELLVLDVLPSTGSSGKI